MHQEDRKHDSDLCKFLKAGMVDLGFSAEPTMPSNPLNFVLQKENIIQRFPAAWRLTGALSYAITLRRHEVVVFDAGNLGTDGNGLQKRISCFEKRQWYAPRLKSADAGFEPNIVMEMDRPQRLLSAGAGSGITFIRASIPYYIGARRWIGGHKINHPDTNSQPERLPQRWGGKLH